jgi:hypothetical protein
MIWDRTSTPSTILAALLTTFQKKPGFWNVALLSLSVLLGCDAFNSPTNPRFDCPSPQNNISWSSYGRFTLSEAGSDSTARQIVSECGWHVFGGHDGGFGDTLQVAPPGEEVVLVWAFNSFSMFVVGDGWGGATHRGSRIGDSRASFEGNHPECMFVSSTCCEVEGADAIASFSGGALTSLRVGTNRLRPRC